MIWGLWLQLLCAECTFMVCCHCDQASIGDVHVLDAPLQARRLGTTLWTCMDGVLVYQKTTAPCRMVEHQWCGISAEFSHRWVLHVKAERVVKPNSWVQRRCSVSDGAALNACTYQSQYVYIMYVYTVIYLYTHIYSYVQVAYMALSINYSHPKWFHCWSVNCWKVGCTQLSVQTNPGWSLSSFFCLVCLAGVKKAAKAMMRTTEVIDSTDGLWEEHSVWLDLIQWTTLEVGFDQKCEDSAKLLDLRTTYGQHQYAFSFYRLTCFSVDRDHILYILLVTDVVCFCPFISIILLSCYFGIRLRSHTLVLADAPPMLKWLNSAGLSGQKIEPNVTATHW